MLTVRPHGTFSTGFDLSDDVRGTVGVLTGSVWREGGRVQVGPYEWELRRQRSRRFVLVGPGGVLATADRRSIWSTTWTIGADRWYELVRPSRWSSRYELRDGGRPVGTLRQKGLFKAGAEVVLPDGMPPPAQVFVVAVTMSQWRRDAAG